MCGIVGIIHNRQQDYKFMTRAMMDAVKHRGPDEDGLHEFANAILGHVRLSIVDLKSGHQPMVSGDNNIGLVFNGEIYGYKDIRDSLVSTGYNFSTNSDTEVILALYQKYGFGLMKYLPGMFAFALWDESKEQLFCARDRFGEKPFFYAIGRNGEFIFASEIKAIIASGLVDPVLDKTQLWQYLNYSYVYPTRTMYSNIYTLPPAHTLTYHDGNISVERYWNLPEVNTSITEQEAVEEFRRLFFQAVKRQLVADVPVGAFLSGGLDSGSVVAAAARLVSDVTTISFAFPEGIDESHVARSMAERYNTNHIEISDMQFDIADLLKKMQTVFDEPFADPAAIPAYLIAKYAREHVKVVLTGDAGDELLGGYDRRYRALMYARQYRQSLMPLLLRKKWLKGKWYFERINRKIANNLGYISSNESILQGANIRDTEIRILATDMAIDNPSDLIKYCRDRSQMMSLEWQNRIGLNIPDLLDYRIDTGFLSSEELANAIRVDLQDYLPGNGFLKTDRTTMAVSLESRTPFCDKDLAEFCISLPFNFKVHGREDKYILRKAMGDMWTEPVRRGVKNGFSPPFGKWLQQKDVSDMQEHYLGDRARKIFELLSFDGVQALRKEKTLTWPIWSLLQLSMWLESHPCILEV